MYSFVSFSRKVQNGTYRFPNGNFLRVMLTSNSDVSPVLRIERDLPRIVAHTGVKRGKANLVCHYRRSAKRIDRDYQRPEWGN